ncbi:MAG: Wadjet anti-phage system protein JetD domain-containing protein [Pirellulales bacterium]
MITPDGVRQKAERAYSRMLDAWAACELNSFFPLRMPADLSPIAGDVPGTIAAVELLRANSKEQSSRGYSIQWKQVRSRDFGNNLFPERIVIDTADDLVSLIGKQKHFSATCRVAERIRDRFPALCGWVKANIRRIADCAEPLEGLLRVTQFFLEHPWPDCYARQIPVAVDTKFVERHETILRQWLDELLPGSAIQADESKFAWRFGLRDGQPYTTLRTLDPILQSELGLPYNELSLPLRTLETLALRDATVIIVENQLNLLTLPQMTRALAFRGEGRAVTRLRRLHWLMDNKVLYWGDIDVEGFQILSSLRMFFPHVRSILMTDAVLRDHNALVLEGSGAAGSEPRNLVDDELAAFRQCQRQNWRLEQERLPQSYVDEKLEALGSLP